MATYFDNANRPDDLSLNCCLHHLAHLALVDGVEHVCLWLLLTLI